MDTGVLAMIGWALLFLLMTMPLIFFVIYGRL